MLIEENAKKLRTQYLAWIYELGETRLNGRRIVDHLEFRQGFSYWWMTLLAEKCNFSKSPHIDDAIRLLAFTEWASGKSFEKVTLASSNQGLAECLRQWCNKIGVHFEWRPLTKSKDKYSLIIKSYEALPLFLQACVWLIKYLYERYPLRGVGFSEWRQSSANVTFVSYLFNLNADSVAQGRYECRYWAHLPDDLRDQG